MSNENFEIAVSAELLEELRRRVNGGEFRSVEEVVETALAYYFERHTSEAMAKYVDEELQTGLEGSV